MRTYSDVEIDRWAEIFRANRMHERGISFGHFMRWPELMLKREAFGLAKDRCLPAQDEPFLPLLPRQVRAQREADFQETLQALQGEHEAALARRARAIGCRRRTADVRVSDGRLLEAIHPRAVVGARCTGGHR